MSVEDFHKAVANVKTLPIDAQKLENIGTKPALSKHLFNALKALEIAEQVIARQSDSIISTNAALVKQCLRSDTVNTHVNHKPSNDGKLYSDMAKTQTIILKPNTEDIKLDSGNTREKIEVALKDVSVRSARITKDGNMVVNLPDNSSKTKASEKLAQILKDSVSLENPKKILPKITIIGLPCDLDKETLARDITEKDENLKTMIEGGTFDIIGCWDIKDRSGEVISKKIALKVSPDIRKYLIENNRGYIYINLARYRVYDRFVVPQCFHCYGFNHFATHCPKKDEPASCGKCSKSHSTRDCTATVERCINCIKNSPNKNNKHCAFSYKCPEYEKEKSFLINRTEFDSKNH